MGMSVEAFLIMGLQVSELDITKAPGYAAFAATYDDPTSWRMLVGDYYYENENKDLADLKYVGVVLDWIDDDQQCVGYELAKSGVWDIAKLDMKKLYEDLGAQRLRFRRIFKLWPEVLIVARARQ